ncbi:phosphatidic acid phosphatase type 2/haloperoxidase [Chaetomium tenue]|uniref:Phosphatidic acid phosphatase type 2/haloperoxidase n=1 Tax=Chaetomium tenue TaxID=1854479 RepID=A0ACB7PGR7_9PEZI|nr:phosphatidic acid phosphatase type 2/haloperoxidase [Chaetomium globosum]
MAPPRSNSNGGPSGGILASFSRFWQASHGRPLTYASDYIGFVLLLVSYLLIQFFVEPFHRMFSLNDLRIAFPHAEVERVPLLHDFIYALFIPLALLTLTNLLTHAPRHKHHVTLLGLAISLILTSLLTDIIKNAVGRPRPDLLARCLPQPNTPPDQLVTIAVCTQTHHHTLHDGWRSFPSGHSSFAFAGLGYLALFLAGQLRIFAHAAPGSVGDHAQKLVRGDLLRALVCGVPLLGATMIAISRCQDYRHDVYDVGVGGLLGYTVGYWSYRRYWPRLGSGRCEEPYAGPPAAGEDGVGGGYGRLGDEEEGLGRGRNVGIGLGMLSPR